MAAQVPTIRDINPWVARDLYFHLIRSGYPEVDPQEGTWILNKQDRQPRIHIGGFVDIHLLFYTSLRAEVKVRVVEWGLMGCPVFTVPTTNEPGEEVFVDYSTWALVEKEVRALAQEIRWSTVLEEKGFRFMHKTGVVPVYQGSGDIVL